MPLKTRPDVDLMAEIRLIERLVTGGLERSLPGGLSAAGFDALSWLALQPDGVSSPLALATAVGAGKSAMTHTLQRLEALGLVSLADDPSDGRRKIVALTEDGAGAYRAALAAARPRLEALRQAFDAEEFERGLPFLRRLRAWFADHG